MYKATFSCVAAVCAAFFLSGCVAVVKGTANVPATVQPEVRVMQHDTGFINKTMTVGDKQRAYVVYVPRNYDPDKAWPLILFLHGAGERGDDGLIQSEVGIGRAIRRWPDRFPCIVAMPQCPNGVWWDGAIDHIDVCLKKTLDEFNIDRSRVYLTGLSMGGFGTWQYGAQHTDVFAALLPICGGGRIQDAAQLAHTPIWAFHGAKDDVVPVDKTREMVKAVQAAGGSVKFTEYPDLNHNSWDATYEDPKSIAWLLDQKK